MEEALLNHKQPQELTPWMNIICMVVTIIALTLLIQHRMNVFNSTDPQASLSIFSPEQLHRASLTQAQVDVGLHINNIPEFNVKNGVFTLDAIVWFSFDPRLISVTRINNFYFEDGIIQNKVKLTSQLQGDGKLLVYYAVNVTFNMALNFTGFPFDDHVINFVITNPFFTPEDIYFRASRNNLTVPLHFDVEEWQYVDKVVRTGYSQDTLNPYKQVSQLYNPKAIFSMCFKRKGMRYIVSIIVPLMLLFFIAFFSFSFDAQSVIRIDLVMLLLTLVTGIIGYRYTIESLSPAVGYFMVSDYLFLFLLTSISLILITNIFLEQTTAQEKKHILLFLYTVLIALFIYLLNPWSS